MADVFLLRPKVDDGISRSEAVLTTSPDTYLHTYEPVHIYRNVPEGAARELHCIEGSKEYVQGRLEEIVRRHEECALGVRAVLSAFPSAGRKEPPQRQAA